MTTERNVPLRWWGAGFDVVVGIVVFVLMWFLVGKSALKYLPFLSYTPPPPTPQAIAEYWVHAAIVFAIIITGFVVAVLQRRTPAMVAYPIVAIVTLAVVLLVAIPQIDWRGSDDVTYAPNPNYCSRTDSENCPGG